MSRLKLIASMIGGYVPLTDAVITGDIVASVNTSNAMSLVTK